MSPEGDLYLLVMLSGADGPLRMFGTAEVTVRNGVPLLLVTRHRGVTGPPVHTVTLPIVSVLWWMPDKNQQFGQVFND